MRVICTLWPQASGSLASACPMRTMRGSAALTNQRPPEFAVDCAPARSDFRGLRESRPSLPCPCPPYLPVCLSGPGPRFRKAVPPPSVAYCAFCEGQAHPRARRKPSSRPSAPRTTPSPSTRDPLAEQSRFAPTDVWRLLFFFVAFDPIPCRFGKPLHRNPRF